ncbi:MAG: hypothetical protein IJU37_09910 [Desulfovibrio sp.]|nr:hypothetical protein [Desulfovibrio sp.]
MKFPPIYVPLPNSSIPRLRSERQDVTSPYTLQSAIEHGMRKVLPSRVEQGTGKLLVSTTVH